MTPRCLCGETATGLVVEGHLHPYCAYVASEERAKRAEQRVAELEAGLSCYVNGCDLDSGIHYSGDEARRLLAADREGRS